MGLNANCLVPCNMCIRWVCDGETLQLMRLLMSKQCQGRRDYSERNRLLVQHFNRRYSRQYNAVFQKESRTRFPGKGDLGGEHAIPENGGGKNQLRIYLDWILYVTSPPLAPLRGSRSDQVTSNGDWDAGRASDDGSA